MSSPGELMNEILEEFLGKLSDEGVKVDTSKWFEVWDLKTLGRGPHSLSLIKEEKGKEIKIGEIEFKFMINPDADEDYQPFYIVDKKSVVIHRYPEDQVRMKITPKTKIKEMKAALERAQEWFSNFGYNVYGIAVSDDFEDHTEIIQEIKYALELEVEEEKNNGMS